MVLECYLFELCFRLLVPFLLLSWRFSLLIEKKTLLCYLFDLSSFHRFLLYLADAKMQCIAYSVLELIKTSNRKETNLVFIFLFLFLFHLFTVKQTNWKQITIRCRETEMPTSNLWPFQNMRNLNPKQTSNENTNANRFAWSKRNPNLKILLILRMKKKDFEVQLNSISLTYF